MSISTKYFDDSRGMCVDALHIEISWLTVTSQIHEKVSHLSGCFFRQDKNRKDQNPMIDPYIQKNERSNIEYHCMRKVFRD